MNKRGKKLDLKVLDEHIGIIAAEISELGNARNKCLLNIATARKIFFRENS